MSNEYTPTTGQVRVAYVRAIRNAFVGSTSEHRAEFIRWLTKAEAEAEVRALRVFLGHDDTKSIGIGYLKGFASVAFTGVIIVVAVKMYQALLGGWLGNIGTYDGDMVGFIFGNFGQFFVAPIVLIFLLFGANGLAKKVIGEG